MSGYKIIRGIACVYVKLIHRVKVHGAENLPADGNCVIVANHSSFSDPLFVACAFKRQIYFVAKSDLLKSGFMTWVLKKCDAVTINRGESDLTALRKVCEITNAGNVSGIFPQGTRIPCDSPDPATVQPGVGLIALRAKAPVLPVAICYGKNKKPTLFKKVHVYVGKPISYEEYSSIGKDGERATSHEVARYCFDKVCDIFAENNHG